MGRLQFPLALLGLVTTDDAACGRAHQAMMAGDVSGDATDDRAFDAAFRIGRTYRDGKCERQSGAAENGLHAKAPFVAVPNPRSAEWFR
jgi:hypothetical protein